MEKGPIELPASRSGLSALEVAVRVAEGAGQILLSRFHGDKEVSYKGRANLVSDVDKLSERQIIAALSLEFPGVGFLAEESEAVASTTGYTWVIDPLDGTTNYAHQFPMFSVSVGFEQDGKMLCGAVYDPVRDEMFTGSRVKGAFLNGEPILVSDVSSLSEGLLLTGFPYDFREKVERALDLFRSMLVASQAVRRAGSAALDLCYIACGRADGFWELELSPWDTAAGLVIAEEAGGRVSNFDGGPFSIYSREILSSNGSIHEAMLSALAGTHPR